MDGLKRYDISKPVNMTDKYLYDIAFSLRELCDALVVVELDEKEEDLTVEDVSIETINSLNVDEKAGEDIEDLEGMTVPELKEIAKDMGISGYSNMRKSELVDRLLRGE